MSNYQAYFRLGAMGVSLIFDTGFLATVTNCGVGFIMGLLFAVFFYLFYLWDVAAASSDNGGSDLSCGDDYLCSATVILQQHC